MNLTVILQIASGLIGLIPQIAAAWNSSTGTSLEKVLQVVQSSGVQGLETWLAEVGGELFPNLAPNLQAAAAALIAAESHTGAISWTQSALNLAQAAGLVQFTGTGTTGNTPLAVDGIWGPHTSGAILALQTKFGLPTTGMFADSEIAILQAATSGSSNTIQAFLQSILAKL